MSRITPTSLTESEIKGFQELCLETFGYEITREEAIKEGIGFLRFLTTVIYQGDFLSEEQEDML